MRIDKNSTIYELANHQFRELRFNPFRNYKGPLVQEVMKLIARAGGDTTNTNINTVGIKFRDVIMAYQRANNLPVTGVLNDDLLHHIYKKAEENSNNEIKDNTNGYKTEDSDDDGIVDPHYDPFFLNKSSKDARKNHKDIVIEMGKNGNMKIIKDVFMRSVSVEVDTSGNPISEIYNFVARDIKESDAKEDRNKYIGEESNTSSSSDIKYSYSSLFKDK